MNEIKCLYKKIEIAKNGTEIPILQNDKSVESKYNPQKEAEIIINNIKNEPKNYDFFLVLGIASGSLIEQILINFPQAKIIGVEFNQIDIDFLLKIKKVKQLYENENIIFSDIKNLQINLIKNYLPAKYGDLKIIELFGWSLEQKENIIFINNEIKNALKIISSDFSVQAHFGKIWQKNILNNLKILSKNCNKKININFDTKKTAVIIGAGPSLDFTLQNILKKRDDFFIISTDTAFSTLQKNKIIADVVFSIDGQMISVNHFFMNNLIFNKTLFLFDFCANFSCVNNVKNQKYKFSFFQSGHPFVKFASNFNDFDFPLINTGSGTVTICALDFAIKSGFTKILVLGADFCYQNGKPYAKGTYFDSLYFCDSNKINTTEHKFSKLMFRTPLIKIDEKKKTTTVLCSYKDSFENYLKINNLGFTYKNSIYEIQNTKIKQLHFPTSFNFDDFIDYVEKQKQINTDEIQTAFLPLNAFLKTRQT